jgi:Ca2+-binding EF-hand superfamily protein
MKRFHAIVASLTACCLFAPAIAEEETKQRAGRGIDREQILKQFDANGDGRLDEAERAKAKESFANRKRQGNRPGQGKAGQGRPGQTDQDRPNIQQLLKQFDKDGDGQLNNEERAAAREQMEKMRRGQAGKGGADRIQEQALKRFDKDGDGKLNEEERAAAMKAREEFMKKNGKGGAGRPNGQDRPNMKEILAKFDKDGDGKLNETERDAARVGFAESRQQRGDAGRPAAEAKGKPSRVDKKELLAKFDADGDGKLNDDEKAAARAAFQNRAKE